MSYYYIQYWSNLDNVYVEDCVEADSKEEAIRLWEEADYTKYCELVSVEIE